jgi:hypothetical protein
MSDIIVNKVAESGIITLDLEQYLPREAPVVFDLKEFLFMGLILKEKEFRLALKDLDLNVFKNETVAVTCSADAIIPSWAYMLVVTVLQPVAKEIVFGNSEEAIKKLLIRNIRDINASEYEDKRVVVKGCGETPIPEEAYLEITTKLRPVVKSIMFGEPCSTVPVYKKAKEGI